MVAPLRADLAPIPELIALPADQPLPQLDPEPLLEAEAERTQLALS